MSQAGVISAKYLAVTPLFQQHPQRPIKCVIVV